MNICNPEGINNMSYEVHNPCLYNLNLIQKNLQTHQTSLNVHEFSFQPQNFVGSSSASDGAEGKQPKVGDDRKQRRMISNRESARRSRMRKKRQIHELWAQLLRLTKENTELIDKLNHVSLSQEQVIKENSQLKREATSLRETLTNMQLDSDDFQNVLRDLDVTQYTAAHLRSKSELCVSR